MENSDDLKRIQSLTQTLSRIRQVVSTQRQHLRQQNDNFCETEDLVNTHDVNNQPTDVPEFCCDNLDNYSNAQPKQNEDIPNFSQNDSHDEDRIRVFYDMPLLLSYIDSSRPDAQTTKLTQTESLPLPNFCDTKSFQADSNKQEKDCVKMVFKRKVIKLKSIDRASSVSSPSTPDSISSMSMTSSALAAQDDSSETDIEENCISSSSDPKFQIFFDQNKDMNANFHFKAEFNSSPVPVVQNSVKPTHKRSKSYDSSTKTSIDQKISLAKEERTKQCSLPPYPYDRKTIQRYIQQKRQERFQNQLNEQLSQRLAREKIRQNCQQLQKKVNEILVNNIQLKKQRLLSSKDKPLEQFLGQKQTKPETNEGFETQTHLLDKSTEISFQHLPVQNENMDQQNNLLRRLITQTLHQQELDCNSILALENMMFFGQSEWNDLEEEYKKLPPIKSAKPVHVLHSDSDNKREESIGLKDLDQSENEYHEEFFENGKIMKESVQSEGSKRLTTEIELAIDSHLGRPQLTPLTDLTASAEYQQSRTLNGNILCLDNDSGNNNLYFERQQQAREKGYRHLLQIPMHQVHATSVSCDQHQSQTLFEGIGTSMDAAPATQDDHQMCPLECTSSQQSEHKLPPPSAVSVDSIRAVHPNIDELLAECSERVLSLGQHRAFTSALSKQHKMNDDKLTVVETHPPSADQQQISDGSLSMENGNPESPQSCSPKHRQDKLTSIAPEAVVEPTKFDETILAGSHQMTAQKQLDFLNLLTEDGDTLEFPSHFQTEPSFNEEVSSDQYQDDKQQILNDCTQSHVPNFDDGHSSDDSTNFQTADFTLECDEETDCQSKKEFSCSNIKSHHQLTPHKTSSDAIKTLRNLDTFINEPRVEVPGWNELCDRIYSSSSSIHDSNNSGGSNSESTAALFDKSWLDSILIKNNLNNNERLLAIAAGRSPPSSAADSNTVHVSPTIKHHTPTVSIPENSPDSFTANSILYSTASNSIDPALEDEFKERSSLPNVDMDEFILSQAKRIFRLRNDCKLLERTNHKLNISCIDLIKKLEFSPSTHSQDFSFQMLLFDLVKETVLHLFHVDTNEEGAFAFTLLIPMKLQKFPFPKDETKFSQTILQHIRSNYSHLNQNEEDEEVSFVMETSFPQPPSRNTRETGSEKVAVLKRHGLMAYCRMQRKLDLVDSIIYDEMLADEYKWKYCQQDVPIQ